MASVRAAGWKPLCGPAGWKPPCGCPRGGSPRAGRGVEGSVRVRGVKASVWARGVKASVWVSGAGDPRGPSDHRPLHRDYHRRLSSAAVRPTGPRPVTATHAHRLPLPTRVGLKGASMGPAPWEVRAPYPVLGPMAPLYLTPKGSTHVVGGAYRYVSRETCTRALRPPPRGGSLLGPGLAGVKLLGARRGESPRVQRRRPWGKVSP